MAGTDHLINGTQWILITVGIITPQKGRCGGNAGLLRQRPSVHPTEGVGRERPSSPHPGESGGRVVGAEGGGQGHPSVTAALFLGPPRRQQRRQCKQVQVSSEPQSGAGLGPLERSAWGRGRCVAAFCFILGPRFYATERYHWFQRDSLDLQKLVIKMFTLIKVKFCLRLGEQETMCRFE